MPQGVVVYAGNNSRLRAIAFRNLGGTLLGYLAIDANGHLVKAAVPKDKTRLRYTVVALVGPRFDIEAPLNLKGTSDVWSPSTGTLMGKLAKEDVQDATGKKVTRRDSNGMFEVVAMKLKKVHSLPSNLIKEFSNVHDDFAEGGTKDESRANFFAALKSAPGTGKASELDFFAYSGHGSGWSLPSAGVARTHLPKLAAEITRLVRSTGTVVLYACSTGTPKGFAQQLSALLPNMTVWGHLPPPGPASINPRKMKFKGGTQQRFLDEFSAPELAKWKAHVISSADFYARYPFMSMAEIRAEIGI